MKILIAADGSAHAKRMLAFIGVTHEALYRCVAALEKRGVLMRGDGRLRLQASVNRGAPCRTVNPRPCAEAAVRVDGRHQLRSVWSRRSNAGGRLRSGSSRSPTVPVRTVLVNRPTFGAAAGASMSGSLARDISRPRARSFCRDVGRLTGSS